MTAPESAAPAIAGAAQVIQRPGDWSDPAAARGPIELMVDAARAAAEDAGSAALLAKVGYIGVAGGLWSFLDPGQLVAARIGAPDAVTAKSAISGSAPQDLVGIAAERIATGEIEVALVVGGEARASSVRLRKADEPPRWVTDPGTGTAEDVPGITDDAIAETLHLGAAAPAYALMEDSLRRSLGRSVEDHRDRIAALWQRFNQVAVGNPFAWDRTSYRQAEIRDPSAQNRMIAFPYPKAMVANNTVDMASAVLLCSVAAARAAGVDTDRLVFPHVATSSHDTWLLVNRDVLHEAPALTAAGRAAFDHVGIEPAAIDHLDLYACFPSIVEMSVAALGFDPDRELTVTGGLGFAGAPIANATGQAIAAMVPRLRDGGYGMVHANGGSATKHAFGIYSAQPPAGFRRISCQPELELHERPAAPADWTGDGAVEAATVMYDRGGPSQVIVAMRTATGARALLTTDDPDLMMQAEQDGLADVRGPLPGARPIG